MPRPLLTVFLLALCGAPASSQGRIGIVQLGRAVDSEIASPYLSLPILAPGQLTTLVITGTDLQLKEAAATEFPLPVTLGGVSILMRRFHQTEAVTVPLSKVKRGFPCPEDSLAPLACAESWFVTLQVPYEFVPFGGIWVDESSGILTVRVNGVDRARFWYQPAFYRPVPVKVGYYGAPDGYAPLVTKENGDVVSIANPAKPGETVRIFATGLGKPSIEVVAGTPSPDGAFLQRQSQARLDWAINFAENPYARVWTNAETKLTPGSVGLYETRVRIPEPPPSTPPCRLDLPGGGVVSNLTILTHVRAAICVVAPGQVVPEPVNPVPRFDPRTFPLKEPLFR